MNNFSALDRDEELTAWIKDTWDEQGLDQTELATYNFFLSWPNQTNPNKIYLIDGNGEIKFTSTHKEKEVKLYCSHWH